MEEKQYMPTEIMLAILHNIGEYLQKAKEYKEKADAYKSDLIFQWAEDGMRAAYDEQIKAADKLIYKYKDCHDKFGHNLFHLSLTNIKYKEDKNKELFFRDELPAYLIKTGCFDIREKTNYGLMPLQVVSWLENPSVTGMMVDTGEIQDEDYFYKLKQVRPVDLFEKGIPMSQVVDNFRHMDKYELSVLQFLIPMAYNCAYINGVCFGDPEMVEESRDAAWEIATKLHPNNKAEAEECYRLYLGVKEYGTMKNAMKIAVENQDVDMISLLSKDVSVFEEDADGENALDFAKNPKYFNEQVYEAVEYARDQEIRECNGDEIEEATDLTEDDLAEDDELEESLRIKREFKKRNDELKRNKTDTDTKDPASVKNKEESEKAELNIKKDADEIIADIKNKKESYVKKSLEKKADDLTDEQEKE